MSSKCNQTPFLLFTKLAPGVVLYGVLLDDVMPPPRGVDGVVWGKGS
jgi:hypothetical protein